MFSLSNLVIIITIATALPSSAFRHARSTQPDPDGLSIKTLRRVEARLSETATDTWVSGTHGEALLELYYPSLSVFSDDYASAPGDPSKVEKIVDFWLARRVNGSKELAHVDGGAAGDPPSLGVPWLVTSKTTDDPNRKQALWDQATEQLDYLLNDVPRTLDGAISHRPPEEKVQLWDDFYYMVPPFIAYYGALSHNTTLLKIAYEQCRLYRQYLKPQDSNALRHIALGDWQDNGLWGTGNAWATAGMTRVIATLQNSAYRTEMYREIYDLKRWTRETIAAAFSAIQPDGLVLNYYDNSTSFTDSAASALLAATAYRLAVLDREANLTSILDSASTVRSAVNKRIDQSTGWLAGAVNPLSWKERTDKSPEAQAFVLLLHSAWRDYQLSR